MKINEELSAALGIPLSTQCLINFPSQVFNTPHVEETRHLAERMLEQLKTDDKFWAAFQRRNPEISEGERGLGVVEVQRHAIRMHETPGGAWFVVEKLVERGWTFRVKSVCHSKFGPGWRVCFTRIGFPKVVHTLDSFPEATCAAAFDCIAAEKLRVFAPLREKSPEVRS